MESIELLPTESELRRNLAEFNLGWRASDDDLEALPPWAVMAYAGRVVDRILPVYSRLWPTAPKVRVSSLAKVIEATSPNRKPLSTPRIEQLHKDAQASMQAYEKTANASHSTISGWSVTVHSDSGAPSNICEAAIALCEALSSEDDPAMVRYHASEAIGYSCWAIEGGDLLDETFEEVSAGWLRDFHALLQGLGTNRLHDPFGPMWPEGELEFWLEGEPDDNWLSNRLTPIQRRAKAIGEWTLPRGSDPSAVVRDCAERLSTIKVDEEELRADRKKLAERLSNDDLQSAKLVSSRCDYLAEHYGLRGTAAILNKNPKGWADVDLAMRYRAWGFRYAVGVAIALDKSSSLYPALQITFDSAAYAAVLCYAYASGNSSIHRFVADTWHDALRHPNIFTEGVSFWEGGTQGLLWLEPFCLRLFRIPAKTKRWELPRYVQSKDLGPYYGVIKHWKNPTEIGNRLRTALDYHCLNIDSSAQHTPYSAFCTTPNQLIPFWLLASLLLRNQMGLSTPELRHPLLELPTADPGDYRFGSATDPLFNQLETAWSKLGLAS
ncbi:hypothetical protein MalM25_04530 [Planctomycetes bacterium MalM25]|nr:hypothetical protein MalM25_04530 [Planctomycetes bacterium MalM25]